MDLNRSCTDAQAPDIAVDPLDGIFTREAVAAQQLDRFVAHELGRQICSGLGQRSLEGRRRAVGPGETNGALQQESRAFELDGHVGNLPLETLQLGQRTITDLALVHVADRVFERALRGADTHSGVAAALAVGRLQAVQDQRADTLSGGLKRRLNLAIGVVHGPRVLVLDEPTAGVDAQSRRFLGDELKRLNATGMTIIYTSHYLDEVQQLCYTMAVIDQGRVISQGNLHSLLQRDVVTLGFAALPSAVLISSLEKITTASAVQHDGNRVALVTLDPAATLAAALAVAQECGAAIAEATMGHRDLEALFFQLTGKALRDSGADRDAA